MKRMILHDPRPITQKPLHLEETADPVPSADEIVIDVSACAVCRTDLQLVEGDLPARGLPIVPGHQIVGTVTARGAGVSSWSIGDRVAVGWLGWDSQKQTLNGSTLKQLSVSKTASVSRARIQIKVPATGWITWTYCGI